MKFMYMINYEFSYGYPDSERQFIVFSEDIYPSKETMIIENLKQIEGYKELVVKEFDYYDVQPNYLKVQHKENKHISECSVSVIITPVLEINEKYFKLQEV
jgi:hypothetical protein